MANMYNINALSYSPRENMEWFTRALFGGRLIQGGYIGALTGIKGDELLSQIDLQNKILQADGKDCAWTPNQIIKLSEKLAKVKTYKINLEQCIDELENKRTAYQLSAGAKNESLPDELEEATLALIAIGLSNEIEELIIAGDESEDPNAIDGFQTQMLKADSGAIQLAGEVLTKANVLAAIEEAYDAVPEEVLQAEDAGTLYALVSFKTRRLIRNALSTASNQVLFPMFTLDDADKKNPRIFYNGLEIIVGKGMDNNTIIVYDANNALFLTDLLSDLEDIRLGNMPAPKDSIIFIDGRLRLGFVVPFEDEVVVWSNLIEADSIPSGNNDLRVIPNSLVFDVAGETKTFTVITEDESAEISVNGAGSGFTVTAGATTDGVTTVTVVAADGTGSIPPRVGQVVVSIDDTDRKATVTLNQRNDDGNAVVVDDTEGGEEEPPVGGGE